MKLSRLTLSKALKGLKEKKFSSVELVNSCFGQIEQCDNDIKAFITLVKDRALEEAKKADEYLSFKGEDAFKEKPLLGIPYACKDNFCTQGVKTTAASNVLKDFIPPYESTVTGKLKEAGAILIGKTNMDAFAHGSSTETSDFFVTKNPWDKTRLPGGSSGGSAAAVAADMCIFAIGSETGGSIRGPASWCGVTGLKPTYGRVSRYGVIAMASSTDSPGPITKTARDAALVLNVIAGKDPFDATSSDKEVLVSVEKIENTTLKGLRVGRPRSYFKIDLEPNVKKKVEEGLAKLEQLGAKVIDVDLLDPKYAIGVYTVLQRSEVSSNLARFDGIRYGQSRDAFGFEARKRMMLGAYTLSVGYYDQYYAKAQKVRTLIVEDFNKVFKKVDVVVGPAMPCVAPKVGESENAAMFGELMDVLTEASAIAGLSGISVPCGGDLPVGMQVIGPMFAEGRVLGIANIYQAVTDFHERKPPL